MSTPVADIIQSYLTFAATEVKKEGGKPRSSSTMASYRRALESFRDVVQESRLVLTQLPPDFVESKWLPTQAAIANQPVQLRIRAVAIKKFYEWLFINSIPHAPLKHLNLPTPSQSVKKSPQEPTMSNAVLTDVNQLADQSREFDAVPSTSTTVQTTVPLPSPRQVQQPVQQQKQQPQQRANPLAGMMPSGQYKLRVRREREGGEEPVFVGDFPGERVRLAGAIEPFLLREVGPIMQKQNVFGDVSFLVNALSLQGGEGDLNRYVICVPPPATVPVVGVAPIQQAPIASTREELADLLSTSRRISEDLEERITTKLENKQPADERTSDMDDLKQMMRGLAQRVNDLADRVESRDSQSRAPEPVQHQTQAPQLDIIRVIEALKTQQPQVVAQQPMGMVEMFGLLSQAREMFKPQNIQVDTTPLEDDMREMRRELADSKKSSIGNLLTELKGVKELFSLVGGEQTAPKPTFGAAVGTMLMKFIENPAPIAEAAERVLNAAKGLRSDASQQQQPAEQPKVPPQVTASMRKLLAVEDPDAVVVATHEWMQAMAGAQMVKPVQRLSDLVREGKPDALGIFLKTIFKHLDAEVPAEKCVSIAKTIIAKTRKPEDQLEEDLADGEEDGEGEEGEEGEESQSAPDMSIRVGGAQQDEEGAEEEGAEEGAEEEGAEEEGAEAEGDEEEVAEESEEPEAQEDGTEGEEVEASPEEIAEVAQEVTETKAQRRARRKAEKEAAAPAPVSVSVEKFTKPTART